VQHTAYICVCICSRTVHVYVVVQYIWGNTPVRPPTWVHCIIYMAHGCIAPYIWSHTYTYICIAPYTSYECVYMHNIHIYMHYPIYCIHICLWGSALYAVCGNAVCCSVLQCVAVCCSALQCVAVCAVRCSVLQCVAVRCSVLQCVAVRCSALHCVAVCFAPYCI